jgi:ubiquinone/menaquinone biosynthesis C-methylase UbiE
MKKNPIYSLIFKVLSFIMFFFFKGKMHMKDETSWGKVGEWYNKIVGEDGHYYHKTLIIPKILTMFDFGKSSGASLLDVCCGQGVLSRTIPQKVEYTGIDIALPLLNKANESNTKKNHRFVHGDVTKKFPFEGKLFTHACMILAVQNVENPLLVFRNVAECLKPGASFIIVMNHPCFRIPRQSSWKVDAAQKIQYRRIDRYMSPMKIPIQAHPGKGKVSSETLSFHYPLSDYTRWLKESGFVIEQIEEWCSNKTSEGGAAKMENRSREEIPLFMAIAARAQESRT